MKEPLFSIITVCYNAEACIGSTLASVDVQSFTDYEHLIVDGKSSDATLNIVATHDNPLRKVISEPDKGIYDAMNKGIAHTSGKYLIFLNAGDCFHSPGTLESIAKTINDNGCPGIVYGQTAIVDSQGQYLGPRHLEAPAKLTLDSFANGMVVCHQAFVALRRITGKYNTAYRFSADYDWCIQCLMHSRKNIGMASEILIDYLNEGATTHNHMSSLRERFRIMCYYYGTLPTIWRHIRFLGRALKRKIKK